MALYRTLFPLTYRRGNRAVQITRAGVVIDLDAAQAAELAGKVAYIGDVAQFPRAQILYYDDDDAFPPVGDERYVFLAKDTGALYQWSQDDGYTLCLAAGAIDEGVVTAAVEAVIDDVVGDALDGKANVSHTHNPGDITGLSAALTKLSGIEPLADATDATNVDAAGAVMNSDTTVADMSFVIDEDDMASNLATKVPTQQSVKAYVDAHGGSGADRNYGIPTLTITTEGGAEIVSKEDYLNATFELNGQTLTGEIRGRGNSTWTRPKKPYRIRLTSSTSLLGMPASRHWAILANHMDFSGIRNAVAFEVGSRMTGLDWTPRYRPVEVVLNGVYNGLYQLVEIVRFDPNRVNATAASGTTGLGLTGAYLLEIDRYRDADVVIDTTHDDLPIIMDDPDGSVGEQRTYITNWLDDFETLLYDDEEWLDPDTGYKSMIDLDSFIDWYLVNELLVPVDGMFATSVKLYKTADTAEESGRLFMGPMWDYDLSMGGFLEWTYSYEGWWMLSTSQPVSEDPVPGATWIARMLEDPEFVSALEARWTEVVGLLEDLDGIVTTAARKAALARVNDMVIWGTSDHPTWSSAVDTITTWLENRIEWMTENMHTASEPDEEAPSVPEGLEATSIGATSFTVEWDSSTDNVGVTGYEVRLDEGTAVSKTGTTHTFTSLVSETEYSVDVRARDAAGNWSDWSEPLLVETIELTEGGDPPQFAAVGNFLSGGTSSTAPVPVPAGATGDGIVDVVFLYVGTSSVTITPPTGFTEAEPAAVGNNAGQQLALRTFWKRPDSSSGTYDFSFPGGTWRLGYAIRFSGCAASGSPWDVIDAADPGDYATVPDTSLTTTGGNRLLVWWAGDWSGGGGFTPPSGFTQRAENHDTAGIAIATKVQEVAGSTGTVSGSFSGSGRKQAWLGALKP
ncbi:hypothetical protein SEA_BOBBY_44 [Mycobacterium phage Bobby]|nr:hypothetical protein SEA_BOBBY_44 [Mycobacterium phage Bobby]